jgi:hypothetical protein
MAKNIVMYVIYNEEDSYFYNQEQEGWVDDFDLEGGCLFPTASMAEEVMQEEGLAEEMVRVYKIDIQMGDSYSYEPA